MDENQFKKQKVVFVVGSTASGKSDWALKLAKKHNGSIVNIDSVQFYQGLVIGSAAPTQAEKNEVPHYLYNTIQAPNEMTAGEGSELLQQYLDGEKTYFLCVLKKSG